jgi:hypothetical protein
MPIKRHVITFFNMVASGKERPMIAIINAIAVPNGIPLATNTSTIGTTPAALAYMVLQQSQQEALPTNYQQQGISRKILQGCSRA